MFALWLLLIFDSKAQKYILSSPDKKLTAEIEINQSITLKMERGGETVFTLAGLSMEIAGESNQAANMKVSMTTRNSVDEEIQPAIHEKSRSYRNCYNELFIGLKSRQAVRFRLFNEGIAYRLSTSAKDSLAILKENLQVHFQTGDSVRFQSSKTFSSAYESPYEFKKLDELEAGKLCNLPILIQKKSGTFVMFTESDLYNFPGLWVKGTARPDLEAINPQFPKRLVTEGNVYGHGQVAKTSNYMN